MKDEHKIAAIVAGTVAVIALDFLIDQMTDDTKPLAERLKLYFKVDKLLS
jgi:hypothetical protein